MMLLLITSCCNGIGFRENSLCFFAKDRHAICFGCVFAKSVQFHHSTVKGLMGFHDFFDNLARQAVRHRGYMAIVEVCGFNHWLLEKLKENKCNEIVVIQPDSSSNKKTDKRDVNALGELLWNNRKRLQNGQRPNGIRRIIPAGQEDAEVRQLSNFRQFLIAQRTRLINKIKGILNKHNMLQDAPTKLSWTNKFRKWLETVKLPCVDRLEIDAHLKSWKTYNEQIVTIETEIAQRTE